MSSDPGKEVCDPQPLDDEPRSPALFTVDDAGNAEKQSNDDGSVTAYDRSNASPRSGTVDIAISEMSPRSGTADVAKEEEESPKSEAVEVDTNKFHVDISHLEARPPSSGPEAVRYSAGLEPMSNLEILNAQQVPVWMTKKRWFILAGAILLLLVVAIIVIGLVAGLVLARRGGDDGDSPAADKAACGTTRRPVHRQLLAAAAADSSLFVFGRGSDDDMWYRTLSGDNSTWTGPWGKWVQMREKFSGPPTAIDWAPRGSTRVHVFAPLQDSFNVLAAGYENGSLPTSWENLGESVAGPVALCKIPAGFVNAGADPAERIDQWVINRESRGIFHNFWNNVIDGFQEPSTYKDWEGSPSVQQPSASSLGAVCRKDDPVHTLLMYANGTESVRFRHYTGSTRSWSSWVDIGGQFKGDPVLVPVNETYFTFFGIHADGDIVTFNWSNATGLGYRPALVSLGGNLTSMPSAVVTSMDPLRLDVVALGADGKFQHKAFQDGKWSRDWEDLGVNGSSAPLLYKYEVKPDSGLGESRNRTVMAAIGEDNQLEFASWETETNSTWKELLTTWTSAGGSLSKKSMCD
ncbi:hypothetical protein B0T16DRAFT_202575 [Cercophora newfieldiana]|uniref:PLL-like beta propeller domain-containing protein n=1 Tax=Cercophora newfieldiana TaxID=92897 RepID=A0AA40CJL4_9PEZI|nr:hypothetical protein B0T16DRAFT_202575 [Cercophora newfieldiana]